MNYEVFRHPLGSFALSFVDRLIDLLNPFNWSSSTYLAVIVALLLLRVLATWPEHGLGRFVEEFCLILPAGLLYFSVRGLERGESTVAFDHARDIVSLERSLGIFVEPDLQRSIIDHSALVNLFNWIYVWAHWPVILGWVVWMWIRHRGAYPVYRNAVLLSGAAGMTIFALYPAAPPRLLPDLGVVDTIAVRSNSYRLLQPPSLTNIYATMPSLHFGWNLLVGVAIFRHARTLLGHLFGLILPIGMFSAIVLTANHYLLDGLAGGTLALTALAISAYVTPHWSRALNHITLNRLRQVPVPANDTSRSRGCP